jgi:hypothetical protein
MQGRPAGLLDLNHPAGQFSAGGRWPPFFVMKSPAHGVGHVSKNADAKRRLCEERRCAASAVPAAAAARSIRTAGLPLHAQLSRFRKAGR